MRFLLGLLVVVFLGSCASKNSLFVKRRYTNGYYVNFGSHKHVKPNAESSPPLKKTIEQKTELVVASSVVVAKTVFDHKPAYIASVLPKKRSLAKEGGRVVLAHKKELKVAKSFSKGKLASIKKPTHDLGFIPILEGAGVAIVFFIIFTLLYTLCILAEAPEMNIGLALCLGMFFALISICTGIVVTC